MSEELEILQYLTFCTGEVTSCDFNCNYLLAVGLSDRNVRVFEWKTGLGFVDMFYSPLSSHKYGVTSVRFSPKGIMLASSSLDGTSVLYNAQTGSKIFVMVHPGTFSIRYCEFTQDSTKLITAGDNGVFCFWNLVHRAQIRNCQLHNEENVCVKGLAVSPKSEYLLSADSGGSLKLWFIGNINEKSPHCIFTERNAHNEVLSCDFSPVRETVESSRFRYKYFVASCGADSLIKIWSIVIERSQNCEDGIENFLCEVTTFHTLQGHTNDVLSVRFNFSGHFLLSTGMDNSVRLWEVSTGNIIKNLKGHSRFTICSAFSINSVLLATGSSDKYIIIWDLSHNLTLDSQLLKPCNISCHFTNTDSINNWTDEKEVGRTEKCDGQFKVLQKFTSYSTFNSVYFNGNNLLAVGGGGKTLTVLRRKDEKLIFEQKEVLKDHKYSICHLDVSSCGTKVVSCSTDEAAIFWDLSLDLTFKMRTSKCTGGLRTCKFSPNSQFIVAAGDNQDVFLWDANNLEFIKIIQHHEDSITSVAFTPDSKFLVSTSSAGDIKLFSFEANEHCVGINNAHDLGVTYCDISYFANYECQTTSTTNGLYYNENYLLATCGNDGYIKLWQLRYLKIHARKCLSGHGGSVNCVKFSPSEPYTLASCGADGMVRIWDVKSGKVLQILNAHQNAVTTCSFSLDSSLLATGSLDKTVLIWSLNQQIYPELMEVIENSSKAVENWSSLDIANWLSNISCPDAAEKIILANINGKKLLSESDESIYSAIGLKKEESNKLKMQLKWLKEEAKGNYLSHEFNKKTIPHKFLCPLTHEIMKDPVICSDGYTYEKKNIIEWLLTGEFSSPVTKERLKSTKFRQNYSLKSNICKFLYTESNKD